MMTYESIRKKVEKKGYGRRLICVAGDSNTKKATPIYGSRGIDILSRDYCPNGMCSQVKSAVRRFFFGDYGSFDASGKTNFAGYERGCYPSPLGNLPDEGAILIRREDDAHYGKRVCVYLQFEE